MENNPKNYPSLPANYVTIVDLQKRWQQQQQQQQQQRQQQQQQQQQPQQKKEEQMKREKEESNHKLSSENGGKEDVTRSSKFQKFNCSTFVENPNFAFRRPIRGNFYGQRGLKVFREVEKVSNSRTKASEINATAAKVDEKKTVLIKREKDEPYRNNLSNGEYVKRESQFQKFDRLKPYGNPSFEIERPFHRNFYFKKRFKLFSEVEKMSNSMPEASETNAAITKVEIDSPDKEMDDRKLEDEKKLKNEKKKWKKKKKKNRGGNREKQHSATNGECCQAKDRNWKGGIAADVYTTEAKDKHGKGEMAASDQLAEAKDKQGKGEMAACDQAAEVKDKQGKGEMAAGDQAAEAKGNGEMAASDQVAEATDKQGKGEMAAGDQAAEPKDKQGKGEMAAGDQTAEPKDKQGKGEMAMGDQAKDNQEDRQVSLDDQMAEIEAKFKEISVREREWKNKRSMAVKEGLRRVHCGYNRVERSGFVRKKLDVKREKENPARNSVWVEEKDNAGEGGADVDVDNQGEKSTAAVDCGVSGEKSTATVGCGGRTANRWPQWKERSGRQWYEHSVFYSRGKPWGMDRKRREAGGELLWVKRGEVSEYTKVNDY